MRRRIALWLLFTLPLLLLSQSVHAATSTVVLAVEGMT
jgi:hypothetical protein